MRNGLICGNRIQPAETACPRSGRTYSVAAPAKTAFREYRRSAWCRGRRHDNPQLQPRPRSLRSHRLCVLSSANKSSRCSSHACRASVSSGSGGRDQRNSAPAAANNSSNTQRMVKTVGPSVVRAGPIATCRILPPGRVTALQHGPRRGLRAANAKAETRPATPAPTMTTRSLGMSSACSASPIDRCLYLFYTPPDKST